MQESLKEQLRKPSLQMPDLSKFSAPHNIHIAMLTLHRFREKFERLPNVQSVSTSTEATACRIFPVYFFPLCSCVRDADIFVSLAKETLAELSLDIVEVDEKLLACLSATCAGSFPPLCAFLGGVVAQEALKALTGKFTPCKQWVSLHVHTCTYMYSWNWSKHLMLLKLKLCFCSVAFRCHGSVPRALRQFLSVYVQVS